MPSDIPPELSFVDPRETEDTWRACVWAASGQGKTVAAASAPRPILALSADRPSAYKFARRFHNHTPQTLREVRYRDARSLDAVIAHLESDKGRDVRTVVVDPVSNIYDQLVDTAPIINIKGRESPNYQLVNKKLLAFIKDLRRFDVNVVLVAYERLNDGDTGDGKLYPALGGPALINKILGELDICAHIERVPKPTEEDPDKAVWIGRMQPHGNLICKDGTGTLGAVRVADLSRWFEVASKELAPDKDMPWAGQLTVEEVLEEQPPAGAGVHWDPEADS